MENNIEFIEQTWLALFLVANQIINEAQVCNINDNWFLILE